MGKRQIRHSIFVCLLSFVLMLFTPRADAGTIDTILSFDVPPGTTGTIAIIPIPPAPNNDNSTTASPNTASIAITNFGAVDTVDISFGVANSGGTTEYFFDNPVRNGTGVAWTDYHFQLGFGLGQAFVPSTLGDAIDFDTPDRDPAPTSTAFTTLSHQDDSLVWTAGIVPNGGVSAFTFSIDLPDSSGAIPAGFETRDAAGNITGYQFTVRQFPTVAAVPEPASLVLFGAGVVMLAIRRSRSAMGA